MIHSSMCEHTAAEGGTATFQHAEGEGGTGGLGGSGPGLPALPALPVLPPLVFGGPLARVFQACDTEVSR